jgi:hypothetical protein
VQGKSRSTSADVRGNDVVEGVDVIQVIEERQRRSLDHLDDLDTLDNLGIPDVCRS